MGDNWVKRERRNDDISGLEPNSEVADNEQKSETNARRHPILAARPAPRCGDRAMLNEQPQPV
jgi:hypothetical protein